MPSKTYHKSPLRYPGGKSRALKTFENFIPKEIREYREAFLGGGSLFVYILQKFPETSFWINDLHPELYCFWESIYKYPKDLIENVSKIKNRFKDGKELFKSLQNSSLNSMSILERGVRFFVLNRISFSGTTESGGYSESAFKGRFTESSIRRLENLAEIMQDRQIKITNTDYSELINSEDSEGTFIYLDPPYYSATQSRLYGKKGNLHTEFDHIRFAQEMQNCDLQWFISYDNCEFIRKNFSFAKEQLEWNLQYGMNNCNQSNCELGKELIITNFARIA